MNLTEKQKGMLMLLPLAIIIAYMLYTEPILIKIFAIVFGVFGLLILSIAGANKLFD